MSVNECVLQAEQRLEPDAKKYFVYYRSLNNYQHYSLGFLIITILYRSQNPVLRIKAPTLPCKWGRVRPHMGVSGPRVP